MAQVESETGKVMNPRVEIDTSQPFESVKEAVTRFGGSGSWIPLHILRLAGHEFEEMDMETVEKHAAQLEKELMIKEQETLGVLRELESAKSAMEDLKLNLMKEASSSILDLNPESVATTPVNKSTPNLTLCPIPLPPAVILTELKEAKSNLNKTTNDLAMIRASVESLNKKMRTYKANVSQKEGETKHMVEESINDVSNGPEKLTFEAQQFRKMEEAAQYEVIKATLEIEHTKMSIRMVEMRLIAAKKMEEAARAMEAVARAENFNDDNVREGITLSYEEYSALAKKAQKAEEGFKKSDYYRKDANLSTMAFLKNAMDQTDSTKCSRRTLEEALGGPRKEAANGRNLESRNEFSWGRSTNHPKPRNPYLFRTPRSYAPLIGDDSNLINKESRPVLRSSVSIGDILSRKLILQDDIVVRDDVERQTQRDEASNLNQMLREQSGLIFHDSGKADTKEGRIDKQFFTQRKKFGFIHISLPLTKHKKKPGQQTPEPLNMRFP